MSQLDMGAIMWPGGTRKLNETTIFWTGKKKRSQAIEKSDAAAAEFADLHLEDFRISRFPDWRMLLWDMIQEI